MLATAPIRFTQYMRPDGRKETTIIRRPVAIAEKATAIVARGYRFEAEVLMTGEVSFTIHDPILEEDVAFEIVPNGPDVPGAVDRLVEAGGDLPEPGTPQDEPDDPDPSPGPADGPAEHRMYATTRTGA